MTNILPNFNSYMVRLRVWPVATSFEALQYFNSYMVRLREGTPDVILAKSIFQFLHGAIKGQWRDREMSCVHIFQFLHGAIKGIV